ncbi:MAG: hypothetical protein HKN03_04530 [Acidimicrobiales bacterium]|nr:hypothetical protein [Acidimicrobiales bacterium]
MMKRLAVPERGAASRQDGGAHRQGLVLAVVVLVVVLIGVFSSSRLADSAVADESWVEAGWSGDELPNASIVLKSISSSDQRITEAVLPEIREFPGVEFAFVDVLPAGPPIIHLRVSSSDRLGPLIDRVADTSAALGGNGELLVGGQLVADAEINREISRGTLIAVVPVILILGFVMGALHGASVGLATSIAAGLSSFLGGLIGSSVAGEFDGSLGTTVVPGALVALLVSTVVSVRLITWFKRPLLGDSADHILASVRSQLPGLVLVFGALAGVGTIAAIFNRGWSPAVTVFMGALFGALATLAILPVFLSNLPPMLESAELRTVPMRIPDGRDLPVLVVIVVGALLLVLGLIAAGTAASRSLMDAGTVGDYRSSQIAAELIDFGGDPAAAIRAIAPEEATSEAVQSWAMAASRYEGVAWVFTEAGRYEDGELVAPAAAEAATIDSFTAIVTPAESARSAATQATVRALEQIDEPTGVSLEGLAVDAEANSSGAVTTLWLVVALLAVSSGVVVFFVIGDIGLAVVAVALRLLTSAAVLGAYHVIVDGANATELQVAVLIVGVGVSFFEVELLRAIRSSNESPKDFVSLALRSSAASAVAGMSVVAVAGIGLLGSSIDVIGRFGIALTAAIILETVMGIWILRPVVLGEQALRISLPGYRGRSLLGRKGPTTDQAVNPEWRRVVSGLLREEFLFQTQPGEADLGSVFVENTPLFNELAQHNLRLRENGLRIAGEGPTVVSVKAVNDGDPVTVAITVDHPARQLLARDGRLLGVRAAERRDGMLWLAQDPSGRYRIAEAVDMGSGVPLPGNKKDTVADSPAQGASATTR